MGKTAWVVLAEGFEEIEALAPVDILRRAGVRVTITGVGAARVKSSRGIEVQTDKLLEDCEGLPDVIVLPGGAPGADNLAKSQFLGVLLKKMNASGKLIAAICAAPAAVLAPLGILDGKKATCYPGCENNFRPQTRYCQDPVVKDGNVLTSRGPGTAIEFSLVIVTELAGPETAGMLREKMLIRT